MRVFGRIYLKRSGCELMRAKKNSITSSAGLMLFILLISFLPGIIAAEEIETDALQVTIEPPAAGSALSAVVVSE